MHILLHTCCGICASGVSMSLLKNGHKITAFYYNPNIHPEKEYEKRYQVLEKVAQKLKFEVIKSDYEAPLWFKTIKGLEDEPEGGGRCQKCFKLRLEKTYQYFQAKPSFDAFTTTLTISPYKNAGVINEIGQTLGKEFLNFDFKKGGNYHQALTLAKKWNLYRQNYCGCIYSTK
jgi:hypothetical protein